MYVDYLDIIAEAPSKSHRRSNTFAMEPLNSQPSMQSLLNSPPLGEDYGTVQQLCDVGETYLSDHPQMSCNGWATPYSSALERKVEILAKLQLPPDEIVDMSNMGRFIEGEPSFRPMVVIDHTGSTNSEFLSHSPHFAIAASYEDSLGSSTYENSVDESAWARSQDGHHFQDHDYSLGDTPTSGLYPCGFTCGGGYSNRSSMDGCLPSPSTGLGSTYPGWGGTSAYSTDSNSGSGSPGGAPDVMVDGISPRGQRSFVNPKSIQLTPADEGKDDDAAEEGPSNHKLKHDGIPGIHIHGSEWGSINSWPDEQEPYYIQAPIEIECPSPPPYSQSRSSPRQTARLETREERRSRSVPKASQLSPKTRAEMMKPVNKNCRGRGAGKKRKQWACPHHPYKFFKHNSDFRKHMQTQHTRPFFCTFHFAGCAQTFGSKNEWKRHVFSQHLQLHYWNCDHPDCADRNAIFNRKDLFGQHLKRMHGPKQSMHGPKQSATKVSPQMKEYLCKEIPKIQERCRHVRRSPPPWSQCGYCHEKFEGEDSWNKRMEHVGKHYESTSGKEKIDPGSWVMDEGLLIWSIEEGIVEKLENGKYGLIILGKASIEGEEKRKNSMVKVVTVMDDDDEMDMDAEGEVDS